MHNLRLLAYLLLVTFNLLRYTEGTDDEAPEPPFPQMFDPLLVGHQKIHITSEIVSDQFGYQTLDEYLDVPLGKQSLISTRRDGHDVTLVDAFGGYVYNYKPYQCAVTKMDDTKPTGLDGFSNTISVSDKSHRDVPFKLFGVAAIWSFAADRGKTFTYGSITYGASKDTFRRTNTWTVKDDVSGVSINLNFIDIGFIQNKKPESMISSIQITSLETKKVVRTINILSAEYDITEATYDGLLQVPVGYNCIPPDSSPTPDSDDFDDFDNSSNEDWVGSGSRKMDLEVTATSYATGTSDSDLNLPKRSSSTLSVELAYAVTNQDTKNPLQLIRSRNSNQDIKTIIHHQYNTKYIIDLRRGTCELKHIQAKVNDVEPLTLKFANDLTLKLDLDMIYEIFINDAPFKTVKRVGNTLTSMDFLYRESTSTAIFKGQPGVTRIVRTYTDVRLSSVTIWQLDEKQTQILKSFHINIVGMRTLDEVLDVTKVFDVSEECYLNNPDMLSGRDYAWVEFNYNVMSRHMDHVSEYVTAMKQQAYARMSQDYFRMPRMEFVLDEAGFILRLLVLDIPPVETIYDSQLAVMGMESEADLSTISPDLRHCSDLCRLHSCQTMTFCSNNNKCLISSKAAYNLQLKADKICTTHSLPEDLKGETKLFQQTLHSMLSEWQTYDFESIVVPKVPEELTYPISESGLDEKAYNDMALQYFRDVIAFWNVNSVQIALLATNIHNRIIIFLPNKFEIESDPLNEFNLRDDQSSILDSDAGLPPFHEGLAMSRYKMNSFDEAQRKSSRLFSGLSYDQCALACIDARCSSFSSCNHRQECIITSIDSIASAQKDNLIEMDLDCLIAQRDFIGNFNKFPNTFRPISYAKTAAGHTASECAFNCMTSTDFRCLAFSFCDPISVKSEMGTCFYMKDRDFFNTRDQNSAIGPQSPAVNPGNSSIVGPAPATGCSHYTRSYLADFTRIESREIEPRALASLKTTTLEGKSVFDCADGCVNEMIDCSAFQFCFDPDSQSAMQSCTMIQSKLPADYNGPSPAQEDDKKKDATSDLEVVENAQGDVVKAGKLLKPSANCHLFSMRADTSESHLRELALGVRIDGDNQQDQNRRPTKGMSIGGGILLFIIAAILSAAVGCGVCIARERSELVRNKIDQVRLMVGM